MRKGYMVAALITLLCVILSIFIVTSPRWIVDYRKDGYALRSPKVYADPGGTSFSFRSQTNYGLFVYETCGPPGPDRACFFVFYSSNKAGYLYPYYKAGALGGAFIISGILLTFVFMVFMFIKASTGMAGRCMHRVINHYYGLYYLGFISTFGIALGWGLYSHYVPHNFKYQYPFWLCLAIWLTMFCVTAGVFVRKISQGNAKKGGWINIA